MARSTRSRGFFFAVVAVLLILTSGVYVVLETLWFSVPAWSLLVTYGIFVALLLVAASLSDSPKRSSLLTKKRKLVFGRKKSEKQIADARSSFGTMRVPSTTTVSASLASEPQTRVVTRRRET
jgi:hypothetical protein